MVRRRAGRIFIGVACIAAVFSLGGSASAEHGNPGSTVLVSRPTGLTAPTAPTTNNSYGVDPPTYSQASRRTISDNGRYVVFSSDADGLSSADDNRYRNVFVRDTVNNTTTLVSRATDGTAANGNSYTPTISADGTQVAFITDATNLNANDNNNDRDVYVRDIANNTTSAVNFGASGYGGFGSESPSVATAGGTKVLVAFATYSKLTGDIAQPLQEEVYVRDLTNPSTPTTTLVSRPTGSTSTFGNAGSFEPDISADGSTVAFTSDATNLVTGDTNANRDVFIRVLGTNATTLVSRSTGASGALIAQPSRDPSISADGTKVAFVSDAAFDATYDSSGFDIYVRDVTGATTTLASRYDGNSPTYSAPYDYQPSISGDGTKVAFVGYINTVDPAAGGPYVNYQIYVRTLAANTTKLASRPNGATVTRADDESSSPSLNNDGTQVVFVSKADNLSNEADNDFSNVFVRDMGANPQTTFVSRPSGTAAFTGTGVNSSHPLPQNSVSADGRYVLFSSQADNLSTLDNNRYQNVFVRDTLTDQTILVSRADDGSAVDGDSWAGGISADGSTVSFASDGDNLVSGLMGYPEEYYIRTLHSDHSLDHTKPVTGFTDFNEGQQYPGPEGSSLPSGDGTKVAFDTQYNYDSGNDTVANSHDIYVADLSANPVTYTLVDRVGSTLGSGSSTHVRAFSRDGTKVVFETGAPLDAVADTNGNVDLYVRDLTNNTTELVSRADGVAAVGGNSNSAGAGISDDGKLVVFYSNSNNLVSGVTAYGQTYLRDLANGTTTLVSKSTAGATADNYSYPGASISGDGTRVAFASLAQNLAVGTDGVTAQVYVRNLSTSTTSLVSHATGSATPADQTAYPVSLSGNGDCAVFGSNADNLLSGFAAGTDFGNVYMATISRECPVDLPATTINSGPSGPVKDKVGTFAFTSDEAGSTFKCKVDSGAFAACTSPFSTAPLADGAHSFSVQATDGAGYQEASPVTRNWTVDATPPDTTITAGPPAASNASSASFTFTSSENGSTFACSLDGGGFAACSSPQPYSGLADGSHTFVVRATDAVGNDDASPASRSWTVDTTAPKAKITSSPLGAVASKHATFTFNATEAATFACSLDGATPAACSSPQSYDALADGKHTFSVQATDAVGNHGVPAAETWTIDTTAPKATLGVSKQKLGAVLKRGLKVRVSSSEGAIFTITLLKGKKKVGENIGSFGAAGSKLVLVRLKPSARKAFKRVRSLTLTVALVERDTLGNASRRTTRKVKLRR